MLSTDETYIKVKGIKHYVWIIMDAYKMSILNYKLSDKIATHSYILVMHMPLDKFKNFPEKALNFITNGYSTNPLAKQQFELKENKKI